MNKYVFKKYKDPDNSFDNADITFEVEAETLPELLEAFDDFIKGCAFAPKGYLDYVEE